MVQTTSALAFAVVALNAASTMAYPMDFPGDVLERRVPFSEFADPAMAKRSGSLEQRTPYAEFAGVQHAKRAKPKSKAKSPANPPASSGDSTGSTGAPEPGTGGPKDPKAKPSTKDPKVKVSPTDPEEKTSTNPNKNTGPLPTKVFTTHPKPTECKAGEKATAQRPGGTKSNSSSKKTNDNGAGGGGAPPKKVTTPKKKGGPAPVVKPRSAGAAPTPPAKTKPSPKKDDSPAPTPNPKPAPAGGNEQAGGAKGKGKGGVRSFTGKGRDGKQTVFHVVKGTSTGCFEATATPNPKGGKKGGAADADPEPTPAPGSSSSTTGTTGKKAPASKTNKKTPAGKKGPTKTKRENMVAHFEDILERYYGEINDLD